jgi:hypothetical protein
MAIAARLALAVVLTCTLSAQAAPRGRKGQPAASVPTCVLPAPAEASTYDGLLKLADIISKLAVLGGVAVLWKWSHERNDRSAEVLLKLQDRYCEQRVRTARDFLENDANIAPGADLAPNHPLDELLNFYVLLRGLLNTGQVKHESARICFWYFLTMVYKPGREAVRKYVETMYPTLRAWLKEDRDKQLTDPSRFFRPELMSWPTA